MLGAGASRAALAERITRPPVSVTRGPTDTWRKALTVSSRANIIMQTYDLHFQQHGGILEGL